MSVLPNYADSPNCKFYMHKSVYASTISDMVYSAGGATARERAEGVQGSSFLGYPVEFVQVMATAATADGAGATNKLKYPILFGDLAMAAAMGDRRQNTIAFSDSALNAFEQDEIVVRGTERFDLNFHTPGTSSEAGPLVALKLAAS
jgi:HK97 family phage major capsid protein